MIFHNLVVSVLIAASALVQASPAIPRDNEFFSEFLDILLEEGFTKMHKLYSEFAQTPQGPKLISTLQSEELNVLLPKDDAFDSDCASFGDDNIYSILNFINVHGSFYSSKRAPAQSRSVHPTTMPRQNLRKRAWNNQVQVVDTQFGSSSRKRWNETAIFIRGTTTSAQVVLKKKFKNLEIFCADNTFRLPTKVDDTLCKPLVKEAPNGFAKAGEALYQTGLMDSVNTGKTVTLFVPIDEAFDVCESYSADQLKSTVKDHILLDNILFSPYFPSKSSVTALSGNKLKFETESDGTYVTCGKTKAKMLRTDVTTSNGVIHVIDKFLKCD